MAAKEISNVVALLGVLEGRGHVVGSEGLLLDAGGPRIGLICGRIHGSGWQFNRLFGRLNHGLNHFTVLGDDLGHDLGGQITY